jgi:glyoxylase-like metal-dependent hydrolase (beta-lactamase superfamily II)
VNPAQPASLESITVGDIRITYLPDGDIRLSSTIVFPASDDALWAAHGQYLDERGKLVLSAGGFLIETGDRKILVDLGLGEMALSFPPVEGLLTGGLFLDSLKQSGVDPGDVDTVVYTHLHIDHVGWTAQGGALTFPQARHLAGEGEWEFWRGVTDEHLAMVGPHPEAVQGPLENRIESTSDGEAIAPGVNMISTPGHTLGHTSVVVSSGDERAIILGDVIHCPLQLDESQLQILLDVDPALAAQTREQIVAEIEGSPQTIAACGHFSNAVFGRVVPSRGKRWVGLPSPAR